MNSNSTNQHDLVLLQARVDARRAAREEAREAQIAHEISVEVDGDLFPQDCECPTCVACAALFNEEPTQNDQEPPEDWRERLLGW
jgi:hypothetical protein